MKVRIENLNLAINRHFPWVKTIEPQYHLGFQGVSRLVMLDRYAQKDLHLKTLQKGDLVLTVLKEEKQFSVRGVGYIKAIFTNSVEVEVESQYLNQLNPKDLKPGSDRIIIREKRFIEKPIEIFYEQIAWRVANYLSKEEKTVKKQSYWRDIFFQQISSKKIVPGGRVLFGSGSKARVTLFNCFVLPMIKDSRSGIARHRQEAMEIMAHGGGAGTNGSTLRPRGVVAKTVGGRSSGAVSWLNDISQLTHLVEQGGSRRGAQMIMMADWHPDIIEFIISKIQNPLILRWMTRNLQNPLILKLLRRKIKFTPLTSDQRQTFERITETPELFPAKTVTEARQQLKQGGEWVVLNPNFLTGANISIMISDDFMQAVKADDWWQLRFPDLENYNVQEKQYYDKCWGKCGDVRVWEQHHKVKTYARIRAREMWDLVCLCATYSAEPGIFFVDRANKMTNAQAYDMKVVATNPCAEQPLAPYSTCNLSAINLAKFVNRKTKAIKFKELAESVQICVRLQDNVIDATHYFSKKIAKQARGERRCGLGVMGLSDLLIWAGVRYGSKRSFSLIDKIFHTIARNAYLASTNLAVEKGSFPFLQSNKKFLQSGFMKQMDADVRDLIGKQGIRNSHLLTVAPTGTTSTLMRVANGLEPYFAFKYYRSGRLGKFMEINAPIVEQWLQLNPQTDPHHMPAFFVTAHELSPQDHVNVQCIIQRWIDSSISKTVNAPRGYTVREVEKIYMDLFKKGAKTGTVYVDGSRDAQVLSLSKEENQFESSDIQLERPGKSSAQLFGNCTVCQTGTLVLAGGCETCDRCGAQVKCAL